MTQSDIEIVRHALTCSHSTSSPDYCNCPSTSVAIEALSRIEAATRWRDIATCLNPEEDEILVSGASVLDENDMYVCEAYGSINEGFYTDQGKLKNQPTHWLPLPAAPEIKEDKHD